MADPIRELTTLAHYAFAESAQQSAQQALRAARAYLSTVSCEPHPGGLVNRRFLAAQLAVVDLIQQERQAKAELEAMKDRCGGRNY